MSNAFVSLLQIPCSHVAFFLRKFALLALLALFLPSSAMEGDFGRPKTYKFLGYPLDATYWASDATHISGPSKLTLTPEEILMRETAYRLRIQTHNLTPVKLAYAPESAYAGHLTHEKQGYGPSRVTQFEHELRADHEALTRFGDAARRGATLTRQLLAFARRPLVQPRIVDVAELIRDASALMTRALGEDVRLEADLPDDIWPIEIDPGQLEQVLVNLAINARDAMPTAAH